jgi:hypothetical protein
VLATEAKAAEIAVLLEVAVNEVLATEANAAEIELLAQEAEVANKD